MKDYTRVIELFNFELHIQNYSNDWHTGIYRGEDDGSLVLLWILGYRLAFFKRYYGTDWG